MSHSKHTRKGFSLYLEKWNPSAKKYINTCCICGRQGYSHAILQDDFYNKDPGVYSTNKVIYEELTQTLNALTLDGLGRCEICSKIQIENEA